MTMITTTTITSKITTAPWISTTNNNNGNINNSKTNNTTKTKHHPTKRNTLDRHFEICEFSSNRPRIITKKKKNWVSLHPSRARMESMNCNLIDLIPSAWISSSYLNVSWVHDEVSSANRIRSNLVDFVRSRLSNWIQTTSFQPPNIGEPIYHYKWLSCLA